MFGKKEQPDGKYTHLNENVMLGFLSNGLSGGGDRGQSFPRSDAEDLSRGLRFIPGEVTVARRKGQIVSFNQPCHHQCCWYWQFPDGSRHYYWERYDYSQIARANGNFSEDGDEKYVAGPCPDCGNIHTQGGRVKP